MSYAVVSSSWIFFWVPSFFIYVGINASFYRWANNNCSIHILQGLPSSVAMQFYSNFGDSSFPKSCPRKQQLWMFFFLCLQASQIGRESEKLPRTCPYGGRKESASGWCFFLWSLSRGFGTHVWEVNGLLGDFYSSSLEMCCNTCKLWQLTRTLKERENTGLASLSPLVLVLYERWRGEST